MVCCATHSLSAGLAQQRAKGEVDDEEEEDEDFKGEEADDDVDEAVEDEDEEEAEEEEVDNLLATILAVLPYNQGWNLRETNMHLFYGASSVQVSSAQSTVHLWFGILKSGVGKGATFVQDQVLFWVIW